MRHRPLLSGPALVGFMDAFDSSCGDASTPRPYAKIAPARVGGVLLPFKCPRCGEARREAVDPRRRGGYADKERAFSWCPACGLRYVLDPKGHPLAEALPPGAESAPAVVTGQVVGAKPSRTDDAPPTDGLSLLGAA